MIKIEKCINNDTRLQAESIKLLVKLQLSFQRFNEPKTYSELNRSLEASLQPFKTNSLRQLAGNHSLNNPTFRINKGNWQRKYLRRLHHVRVVYFTASSHRNTPRKCEQFLRSLSASRESHCRQSYKQLQDTNKTLILIILNETIN